jgi:copper(I)-binding protein
MRTAAAAFPLLLLACSAPDQRSPDITVADGWTRQVAPGQIMAAVYVTILNRGDGEDRLVGADSPVAGSATLHTSSNAGGIARMRPLEDGLPIPAHSKVELRAGGNHIMLDGLRQALHSGQTIDLNLHLARAGARSVAVRIVPASSAGPGDHGMHR